MKNMFAIKLYPLDCDELLSYTKQYYYGPRKTHTYIILKSHIFHHLEKNYMLKNFFFLETYIEVKKKILRSLKKLIMKTLL